MTDHRDAAVERPQGVTRPENPAEAQFPYVATHGIQPDPTTTPSLGNRPPDHRPRSWQRALTVAAAGLFALTVVGAYLVWGLPHPAFGPRSDTAAAQAVRGYLEALARGDARAALEFGLQPPSDTSLLTDRMLADQLANSPITAIEVTTPIEPGRVPVRYRLGPELVSTVFDVTLQDDVWHLDQVAAAVDLAGMAPVRVAVNGVVPNSSAPALFPGHYRVTSEDPRYIVKNAEFDIHHPLQHSSAPGPLTLSEAGHTEVVAAAEAHLESCLRQRDLDPADCGFAIAHPDQTPLDESSVRWSVDADPDFEDLAVVLDHPGSASAVVDLPIRGDVRGLDGSRWKANLRITRLRADLTGDEVTIQFG